MSILKKTKHKIKYEAWPCMIENILMGDILQTHLDRVMQANCLHYYQTPDAHLAFFQCRANVRDVVPELSRHCSDV